MRVKAAMQGNGMIPLNLKANQESNLLHQVQALMYLLCLLLVLADVRYMMTPGHMMTPMIAMQWFVLNTAFANVCCPDHSYPSTQ